MQDTERVIGRLEEFRSWTQKELAEIKTDVKALNQFQWRVAGGAGVLSVIISAVVTGIVELLRK